MVCCCGIFAQDVSLKSPDLFFLSFDFEFNSYCVTEKFYIRLIS